MALIDVLRKKQQQLTQQRGPAPASVQGMQQQIATGMTGKAQQQQGPAVSGIGQQIAQQQAQAQQQALSQQQEQQATQLAQGIEQQQAEQAFQQRQLGAQRGEALAGLTTQEQMAAERRQAKDELADMQLTAQERAFTETVSNKYSNALADLASERGIVENNIFQNLANERKSLDADKYLAQLSQNAHMLAMSDRRYVAHIQKIGALNDLRDTIAFKKEAMQLTFGQNLKILSRSFDQQRLLNADQRQFAEEMSKMSIDDALAIAEQALKAQETSAAINTMMSGTKTYMSETDWDTGGGQGITGAAPTTQNAALQNYGGPTNQASQNLNPQPMQFGYQSSFSPGGF
jgi:hypothetical protein